ncbi:nuclear transport factor 2 family protein [Candidatus Litorirhabdus singularis]|nr:nuclear transport factor 2 family protein [Candidatus Litorirhabdus singularis]
MQSYYDTYNSENPDALARYYASDVVFETAQGTTLGVAPILETYRYLISVFHDKMTPDSITINGDTAIVQISDRFEAKQALDDFMGQSFAPGDTLMLKLRGTYQCRDGQFSHIRIDLHNS